MYSKVKRLRRGGERLSDRDIAADPGTVGDVCVGHIESTIVARLHAAGEGASRPPLIPVLWRARVVAINADKMLFEGFERIGDKVVPDARMIRQEWAVQLLAPLPPASEMAG
jgi:hypothetical protein